MSYPKIWESLKEVAKSYKDQPKVGQGVVSPFLEEKGTNQEFDRNVKTVPNQSFGEFIIS